MKYKDDLVGQMGEKMAILAGIPSGNFEEFNTLRYVRNQHYKPHMDYIDVV